GRIRLPLDGHAGSPAVPVKKAGDAVSAGDVVAEIPEGLLGARCHSPINGHIQNIAGNIMEISL
ncbi:MAG: hypothetical protein AAB229_05545, partial [Candidatus Hydrogenedentota bacterium]